jgi:DNA-binding response OmpR family regulator
MKKALIVDDDVWLADNYRLFLEKSGWQVNVTTKAADAINLIDDIKPNVVLLDVMLPWSSASALLNELQSHSDIANIPIVLCSSLDLAAYSANDLAEYGVRQVIDKTKVTLNELCEALETAIHATT